jgi:hypothetical protein
MKTSKLILSGILLIGTLSCQLLTMNQQSTETVVVSTEARSYENDSFGFTIPAGWQTFEEVWGRPVESQKDYYGLGLITVITVQYPPGKGEGKAFFSVATSPLQAGEELESRFNSAYENAVPEIEDASRQPYEQSSIAGFEIRYKRPWGEPWWQFQDVWLENKGVIYLLSFHSAPNRFESYTEDLNLMMESFYFKE